MRRVRSAVVLTYCTVGAEHIGPPVSQRLVRLYTPPAFLGQRETFDRADRGPGLAAERFACLRRPA